MIIGLSGKMKSGKDTCADWLVEQGYHKISFADNLKKMCKSVFNLTDEQVYTQEGKERLLDNSDNFVLSRDHIVDIIGWLEFECDVYIDVYTQRIIADMCIGALFEYPRDILQFVGSELMRECIDPDIHATIVKNIIDRNKWDKVVIPDCRFPNEVVAIESWKGSVIRLQRPETDVSAGDHMSETALDNFTFRHYVVNDGTIKDLKDRFNSAIYNITKYEGVAQS